MSTRVAIIGRINIVDNIGGMDRAINEKRGSEVLFKWEEN